MQINTIGFPLGAGMQSASATGGTGLGFIDALGLASGGVAQQPIALNASATLPRNFGPKLAQTLLAQTQLAAQAQSMPATAALPGLQQPTSLSELMATAAKLPGADQAPVAAPATLAFDQPAIAVEVAVEAEPKTAAPKLASPALTPAPLEGAPEIAKPAAPLASVPVAPAPGDAEPQTDILPDAPTTAAPTETAPAKPQKGVRGRTVASEADPVPATDTAPPVPAGMLVINATPQPITPQQPAPREASANAQGGTTVSKPGKAVAQTVPAQDAAQAAPGTGTGTADFARAVAAKTESNGSESNPDGQPQPEALLAATRTEAAAPVFAQHTHGTAAVDTARAVAPATPAQPVIEARAGHLGHSLGVEIARKVELGEETLRIRLNPVELGRIEVTLGFDDKGSLQATVRTETARAMDLLRQDAPELARTLDQAGVRTDAQSFRFENRSGDSGGQQAQQQGQQNRNQFAASDDDAGIAEPIYRPIRSDGQVDLLA